MASEHGCGCKSNYPDADDFVDAFHYFSMLGKEGDVLSMQQCPMTEAKPGVYDWRDPADLFK